MSLGAWPTPSRAQEPPPALLPVGTIRPRDARQIASSSLSVGAETMDRGFTVYRNWRTYLGPLGAKHARIQSGWARTEKAKGVYDWAWLDEVIPDMTAQGVRPWVCLCYGNELYGGRADRRSPMPTKPPEAMEAWKRYVDAFVRRYAQHVNEWEIWNEPHWATKAAAEDYASLLIATAQTIRTAQPKGRIIGLAAAGVAQKDICGVLDVLKARGRLDLIDEVSYHPYSANPDASYPAVEKLRKAVAAYSPRITIRQGENGAPSDKGGAFALRGLPWTERSQAKWLLRRLLGDLARGIPTSCFAIMDMRYDEAWNRKGLLLARDDLTVQRPKLAYRAVRNLAAIFDDTLQPAGPCRVQADPRQSISAFAFKTAAGAELVALWLDGQTPTDSAEPAKLTLTFPARRFERPLHVDLLTGRVSEIAPTHVAQSAAECTFRALPVGDWPILLADRAALAPAVAPPAPTSSSPAD